MFIAVVLKRATIVHVYECCDYDSKYCRKLVEEDLSSLSFGRLWDLPLEQTGTSGRDSACLVIRSA